MKNKSNREAIEELMGDAKQYSDEKLFSMKDMADCWFESRSVWASPDAKQIEQQKDFEARLFFKTFDEYISGFDGLLIVK